MVVVEAGEFVEDAAFGADDRYFSAVLLECDAECFGCCVVEDELSACWWFEFGEFNVRQCCFCECFVGFLAFAANGFVFVVFASAFDDASFLFVGEPVEFGLLDCAGFVVFEWFEDGVFGW